MLKCCRIHYIVCVLIRGCALNTMTMVNPLHPNFLRRPVLSWSWPCRIYFISAMFGAIRLDQMCNSCSVIEARVRSHYSPWFHHDSSTVSVVSPWFLTVSFGFSGTPAVRAKTTQWSDCLLPELRAGKLLCWADRVATLLAGKRQQGTVHPHQAILTGLTLTPVGLHVWEIVISFSPSCTTLGILVF